MDVAGDPGDPIALAYLVPHQNGRMINLGFTIINRGPFAVTLESIGSQDPRARASGGTVALRRLTLDEGGELEHSSHLDRLENMSEA